MPGNFVRSAPAFLLAALVPAMLAAAATRHLAPGLHPPVLRAAGFLFALLTALGIARAAREGAPVRRGQSVSAPTVFAAFPIAAAVFLTLALLLAAGPAALPDGLLLNDSLTARMASPALISIPLFILSGELAVASGIARRLFCAARVLCPRNPRGAGSRTVLSCTLFATVSGVGPGAVTTGGRRLVAGLVQAGFSPSAAAGALACAAGLAFVIPASPPLTVYAAAAGIQTNIVFTAAFVPGLLLAAALFTTLLLLRPRRPAGHAGSAFSPARRTVLLGAVPSLLMPVAVLPALFTGFLTAPEAAAAGAAYACAVGMFVHRRLTPSGAWAALARSASAAASIVFMAAVGGLSARALDAAGVTGSATDAVFAFTGAAGAVLFMNALLFAAGFVMDMPAIVTLVVPLLLPLAGKCGLSPAHFGVMAVVNLAIGLVTPPAAKNLAAAAPLAGVKAGAAAAGAVPFILAMLACLAAVAAWPVLSLWLPGAFGWPV